MATQACTRTEYSNRIPNRPIKNLLAKFIPRSKYRRFGESSESPNFPRHDDHLKKPTPPGCPVVNDLLHDFKLVPNKGSCIVLWKRRNVNNFAESSSKNRKTLFKNSLLKKTIKSTKDIQELVGNQFQVEPKQLRTVALKIVPANSGDGSFVIERVIMAFPYEAIDEKTVKKTTKDWTSRGLYEFNKMRLEDVREMA